MCYNCGCKLPDDPMGQGNAGLEPDGKSITNKTFEEAAKSQGMETKEAKLNTLELLVETMKKEDNASLMSLLEKLGLK